MKLADSLKINTSNIRIREFTMAGQKLRVRVPLASEMEAISKAVDDAAWLDKFEEMKKPFIEMTEGHEKVEIVEDDILIDGKSLKDLAMMTIRTQERITQLVRLLVPSDESYDMAQINYEDIEAEFPFAVQIELMKKITEVISPGYEETRKN